MWVNIFIWLAIEQNNKLSFKICLSKILGCNSPQVVNESIFFSIHHLDLFGAVYYYKKLFDNTPFHSLILTNILIIIKEIIIQFSRTIIMVLTVTLQ